MKLEFHFDFGSPNAYLSHLVLPQLEARIGQTITYVPILLGGVFKATNNVSPAVSMQGILNKPDYAQIETERFLRAHQITDYQRNPDFPINTLMLMRGAVFAQSKDYCFDYINAVYHHMWSNPKKMDEPEVFHAALIESGLPAEEIFAGVSLPDVKSGLIANTEQSVARGNFGSPTFFADDAMFFGKDKLADFETEILANKG
ncbi:MAG: 2-hydroxychromene-2-carboxylate isomerase [Pseudomonadales bacterium]